MEIIVKCSDDLRGSKNIYGEPIQEIVRCKDCQYWVSNWEGCRRNPSVEHWREEDFCNYGERRSE